MNKQLLDSEEIYKNLIKDKNRQNEIEGILLQKGSVEKDYNLQIKNVKRTNGILGALIVGMDAFLIYWTHIIMNQDFKNANILVTLFLAATAFIPKIGLYIITYDTIKNYLQNLNNLEDEKNKKMDILDEKIKIIENIR